MSEPAPQQGDARARRLVLELAVASGAAYGALALAGDLRRHAGWLLAAQLLLGGGMLLAWRVVRGRPRALRWAVGAALAFRLVACWGEPTASDDVYRYVWDGRVQLHGVHPYRHAPDDPALRELRDDDWARINHPGIRTIYPPLSQMLFAGLAATGAGPSGFRLAIGLIDFGVVLALGSLLSRLSLPRERLILYAWNPLAVLETAGSGHVEPLGVLFVVLAAAWIIDRRPGLSTSALAAAIHAKLLPIVLLPGYLRRLEARWLLALAALLVVLALPYAIGGPPIGPGLFEYAERWSANSVAYPLLVSGLEAIDAGSLLRGAVQALEERIGHWPLPWEFLLEHAWPTYLARLLLASAAVGWLLWLTFRRGLDPARESFLALGGVLLLSPTLHPWYLLWVLPFAAAYLSWGWLVLALTVPLAYRDGGAGVTPLVLVAEYLPAAVAVALCYFSKRRS